MSSADIVYKVSATRIVYYQFSHDDFCLLMTLPKLNISCSSCTKNNSLLQTIFLDIKQNSDMEFPIIHVYMSLWVVDRDEFLETESIWICVIHSMTFIVSLWGG